MYKSLFYSGIVTLLAIFSVGAQAQTQAKQPGSVYLSTDAGQQWQKMDLGIPDGAIVNGFAVNGNFVIAGTETHGVFISDDQLQHWLLRNKGQFQTALGQLHCDEFLQEYLNDKACLQSPA